MPASRFQPQVPWFIFDLANKILITTKAIPEEIRDTKTITLTEVQVPGLNYQPVIIGGGGNRKLAFTIRLVRRDPFAGNVLALKAFENLRNQVQGLAPIEQKQFNPNPKVLYYWGVGSLPLPYWVAKVEFQHHGHLTNATGMPQWTDVAVELILDEADPLYKMEEQFRRYSAIAGMALQTAEIGVGQFSVGR